MTPANNSESIIPLVLKASEADILADWIKNQKAIGGRIGAASDAELYRQSSDFLAKLQNATQTGNITDVASASYAPLRDSLTELSRTRGAQGYSPSETAWFVFSLKRPIFDWLRKQAAGDPERLARETWSATELLDRLALHTTEAFQKGREEVIFRQQQDLLELSTPVVKLWDGILALPMIGTLDSSRTQVVMESLLQRIVETGAEIAIIDITGVPTVDTLTAQHLLKTVTAARLMGADCIISGIRPQIAQTIVHLGVDLADIVTKATLADAIKHALQRMGLMVTRAPARA
jgi:rsbT co-antagonist protein RsbR